MTHALASDLAPDFAPHLTPALTPGLTTDHEPDLAPDLTSDLAPGLLQNPGPNVERVNSKVEVESEDDKVNVREAKQQADQLMSEPLCNSDAASIEPHIRKNELFKHKTAHGRSLTSTDPKT